MLSNHAVCFPKLFQAWQPPAPVQPANPPGRSADYLQLPEARNYQELTNEYTFPTIQARFLSDIEKLRCLAHHFVDEKYDNAILNFYNMLKTPTTELEGCLLPLYRETRYQIHQLVATLENHQHTNADQKEFIASQLHHCLSDIEKCPGGVHSRFANSFINLEAAQGGLDGKLFQIRCELFHQFITAFLFQEQRQFMCNIPSGMEVHWYNGLHNFHCQALALLPVDDPAASTVLGDDLIERYQATVKLSVNACTILRKMAEQWADQFSSALHECGIAAWETDAIAPSQMTSDKTEALDGKLFQPINHLLKTAGQESLNLRSLIDENDDGNYRLNRHQEKLMAWLSNHFCGPGAKVFATIPGAARNTSIATIGDLFFWVFSHDSPLHVGQRCTFDADNHISITLPHLITLDFTTWSESVSHALLTQAMEQTDSAGDIASFFLNSAVNAQLSETPPALVQLLTNQLTRKLAQNPEDFQKRLCQYVCDQLAQRQTIPVQSLQWLIETPLLEPALTVLQGKPGLQAVTRHLATWQLCDFSQEGINTLLTYSDHQRLFWQAFDLRQVQILARLVCTGHCDRLIRQLTNRGDNLLLLFATEGVLPGLEYLLRLPTTDINSDDHPNSAPPLVCAARFGNIECLRALLAKPGIRVNKSDDGLTALHFAAMNGHVACVRALLAADDIQINAVDNGGWTPFGLAARFGHAECLEALLATHIIEINEDVPLRVPPLGIAAQKGHTACVKVLLGASDVLVNCRNVESFTPLHLASKNGQLDCLNELLLREGVEVDAKTQKGWTALSLAVRYGHIDCARALLNIPGVKTNPKTDLGRAPLHLAIRYGHTDCVRALLERKDIRLNPQDQQGMTPLQIAADLGHVECMELLLLARCGPVNAKGPGGFTPLCIATSKGHVACVRLLLNTEGIDPNLRDRNLQAPLDHAAQNSYAECLQLLLETGICRVNDIDDHGNTPLHRAALSGHSPCVRLLLGVSGINVNQENNAGWTALHYAIAYRHLGCSEALLGADGIEVNNFTKAPLTPLGCAAAYGLSDCARLLLRHEPTEVNLRDSGQMTPLDHAVKYGKSECTDVLLWAGAHRVINDISGEGCTPLSSAAEKGHFACVRSLVTTTGIRVNEKNSDGLTALHFAAARGHIACVQDLLGAKDIEVNARTVNGWTPLEYAVSGGHAQCTRALLSADASRINDQNPRGNTLLCTAVAEGRTACLWVLLRNEHILVNLANYAGWTPLMCAVALDHTECLKLLLSTGKIPINKATELGWTPMTFAARHGRGECLRLLLGVADIKVNQRDQHYQTPLDWAAHKGDEQCLLILLETGKCRVNDHNLKGLTPLCSAAKAGHESAVEALLTAEDIQVNRSGPDGMTALHYCARYGYLRSLRLLLLVTDINVSPKDVYGCSPLDLATRHGHTECAQDLLNMGGRLTTQAPGATTESHPTGEPA